MVKNALEQRCMPLLEGAEMHDQNEKSAVVARQARHSRGDSQKDQSEKFNFGQGTTSSVTVDAANSEIRRSQAVTGKRWTVNCS